MSLDLLTTISGDNEITSESQTKALIQTLERSGFKLQALAKLLRCHPTNLSQWLHGNGRHWVGEEVRVWLNRHRTGTGPETKADWELLLWVAPTVNDATFSVASFTFA